LILLICFNYLTHGQSPINEFEVTISFRTCEYVRAEFHYISSNSADRDSVCWDFGDGKTNCNSSTNVATHTYSEPGIYTVKLTIWLDGIETQIVKPDLIKVHQAPVALFTYTVSDTALIAPLQVDFNNQSTHEEGDTITYSWMINNSSEPMSNDTNFSYVFEKVGTYEVQLIVEDNNGCHTGFADYIIVKDSLQINEFEYITSSCDSVDSCIGGVNYKIENDTLILFGQVERNCCTYNTAVIIDKIDTVQIPTFESGPTCDCNCLFCFEIVIPEFQRESCVILFDNQIINVNSNITFIVSQKVNLDISVKPNPFKESINIEMDDMIDDNYKIEIFNVQGQLIQSHNISNESTNINTSNISKGFYILIIKNNSAILKTEKLIKD